MPSPWPIQVKMPCVRPPETVFRKTTARLGPGDMAPMMQIKASWLHCVRFIYFPFFVLTAKIIKKRQPLMLLVKADY